MSPCALRAASTGHATYTRTVSSSFPTSPILPPATIGILGGGQLGRMLALAARAMGYRIAVLDPDPDCPAAAIADRVVVGSYDDVGAALRLADRSDVVTYELEHVAADVVAALEARLPVRPGHRPLTVTQDRIAERQFVEAAGVGVAPWRAVTSPGVARAESVELGLPMRVKLPIGGYDGRGQLRITDLAGLDDAWERLGRPTGATLLAELELAFECELSIVIARGIDGATAAFPIARNRHDAGILVETVAPAPVGRDIAERATVIGERLAAAMDLCGTLTAELFVMPDGAILVNELAPRVHNSGHWTIEAAATSQFEQHIRAICGLPLGSPAALAPTAMVNLLGSGPLRPARLLGVDSALADPAVHLHVYDKRRVFERRKMGHVTAVGGSVDEALDRARAAVRELRWADADEPTGSIGEEEVT
jgi:5-(carboxyamino)imidazole ribonucleotide synthase